MPLPPALAAFHPAVSGWFGQRFPSPTPAQAEAWPAIARGEHVLVAAPTGSGKTLTAFLAAIDALVREGLAHGLPAATQVLYISPLKALSNDIHLNLEAPLEGIREALARFGLPDVDIRTAVRTGDTPQSERAALRKHPPHILVTTPESLYVLLGSESGRAMLASIRTVIVDEIHALVQGKRGSHLTLSLQRLEALTGRRLQRVGLSATQKPIDAVARFLVGAGHVDAEGRADCRVIDIGHDRPRDLALEVPPTPLTAVMSNEQWEQVYARIAELAGEHRTTLVFVNTRRMAERAAKNLADLLGKEHVAAHHGSLAKELRLDAEQRLKAGQLKVLVATASLELGIDIGDVELVCQLGSPRSIAAFLQRVGRAGHFVGGVPKGRIFATTRDEAIECAALLDCVRRGELDALIMPPAPLDVLAQQIVAEVAAREWQEDALFAALSKAWPYAQVTREKFGEVVRMLADGFTTRRGTRGAWLHRDAVHGTLRGRAGARMTATMSGGTIPDTGDYAVVLEPQSIQIGTLNEDFAIESLAGDIFQLGNASYRILRVEPGRLRVEDAQGLPPNIPFWLGEAPGRTDELSHGVSRLRAALAERIEAGGAEAALRWLREDVGIDEAAARQIVDYCAEMLTGFGLLPTRETMAMERFFDESGGTQLIIHSPHGSRINKAWGLALRKRFCRSFNFELQAAATENAIVLSLSTSHSFPLDDVSHFLHSNTAKDVLVQALLDAPLFPARWRWNATNALALPRFQGGKKVPPQLQRMKSEDLLATVFPDQVACLENIVGEREVPDHPLVDQTLHDCLEEAMDTEGWLAMLRRLEAGDIRIVARDLTAPSPFAAEALNAAPYAFLDDAPLEERRTQAVQTRRYTDPESARDLGRLDAAAIEQVREDAWPQARNTDEAHDALMSLGAIGVDEADASGWTAMLEGLAKTRRATVLDAEGAALWVAAERLPMLAALHPEADSHPPIDAPAEYAAQAWTREDALRECVRMRLGGSGPVTVAQLAARLAMPVADIEMALAALERDGYVMRGRFDETGAAEQWCERNLLARIHRLTLGRLRREIEPVAPKDFMRFLCDWQHVAPAARLRGPDALAKVLAQLEGFEAAATGWESELLPARVADYSIHWLDELCSAGRVRWSRLRPVAESAGGKSPVRATPIVLLPRREQAHWTRLAAEPDADALSSRAAKVADALKRHGALFFDELLDEARLLQTELEDALAELVARGLASCDSFAGLRALLLPQGKRPKASGRRLRRGLVSGIHDAGRWSLLRRPLLQGDADAPDEGLEHIARVLLRRYGVVCWRLLEREAGWLPPWRDLLRVYRRMEARGELRGGRFVSGLVGEQFALPEAVAALRQVRKREPDGAMLVLSATDPLNLAGTLLAGDKVPRTPGNRLLLRDGVPLAAWVAGKLVELQALDAGERAAVSRLLASRHPRPYPASTPPPRDPARPAAPPTVPHTPPATSAVPAAPASRR
ncbi:ATP-dependent DNA helicase [Lysobacter oculi]|uniref:ATP-dependent DNA helicase n=1 Tax=Solilutibacter oculi TaxID=2698682 RepID=A0A344J8N7_9GAMM|nr:DEAD/DEAH box helicase [Lysobacter oculi]AXA85397.1 ATP-dependent DNA helicase [Lysobacter oculi]